MTTYTSRETYEFINKETNDPIVEWKTCRVSDQPFPIYQSDVEFYEKISPTFNGKKYQIPLPTLCPEERARRRYARRNERRLYRRVDDFSGREIISDYSPDKPYKVYDQKMYWTDQWDAMKYGIKFDTSQPFLPQFADFFQKIPHPSLYSINPENAEYTNFAIDDKNCYLVCCGGGNENCFYVSTMANSDHCADGFCIYNCSYCYEAVCIEKCYNCSYIVNCNSCSHSIFLEDCQDCANCVMCFGLVNKKNYFLNQPVSEEQIKALKNQISDLAKPTHPYQQKFALLKQKSIRKSTHNVGNEKVTGEMIINSKDCHQCYAIQNCEDCRNINFIHDAQGSRDCDYAMPFGTSYSYNMCSGGGSNSSMCSYLTVKSSNMLYCAYCFHCRDCFACVGLHDKQYCIFNVQYPDRKAYEEEVARIIEVMQMSSDTLSEQVRGDFFHPILCPFGYNETVANEYMPLEKEHDLYTFGYKWSDFSTDPKIPENAEFLSPAKMTDEEWKNLTNDDRVLSKIILCETSGRPFIIQKLELDFYRKIGVELPKLHPDHRHERRIPLRPVRASFLRTCDKCGKEMVSIYPAEEVKTVYCEECYRQEVYG